MASSPDDSYAVSEFNVDHKKHFLNQVSQELRAPLNAIIGFSEILNGEAGETLKREKRDEYASLIYKAALHLENTLKDTLVLSKLDKGAQELFLQDVDINSLIQDTISILEHSASSAGVHVTTNTAYNIPTIKADKRVLTQILLMIIAYAIETSNPEDKVSIRLGKFAGKVKISISGENIHTPENFVEALEGAAVSSDTDNNSEALVPLTTAKNLLNLHRANIEFQECKMLGKQICLKFPIGKTSSTQKPFNPLNDIINLNDNKHNISNNLILIQPDTEAQKTG